VAKTKGRSSEKVIPEVAEMIFNGASQSEVAEHLGVTPQRVSQIVRTELYRRH
jgi:predicted transcriptional regulator